jgi:transcriptional regulator with XRE-family HTH domain
VILTMPFGYRLRTLREAAGLTQEGLARRADLSHSGVSKLETAGIDPSWSTVIRLAKALGVNASAFEDEADSEGADDGKPAAKPRRKKGGGK